MLVDFGDFYIQRIAAQPIHFCILGSARCATGFL